MSKNNALINAAKMYRKQFDAMIPKIYAAFCISMHEEGWGFKRLARVLVRSQELWMEAEQTGEDMCARCLNETGIDVRYGLNSKPEEGWSNG